MHKHHAWELVEESIFCGRSAALFKKRTIHATTYKLCYDGNAYDNMTPLPQYFHCSNAAFNALEAWEVSVGILPSDYNPEAI